MTFELPSFYNNLEMANRDVHHGDAPMIGGIMGGGTEQGDAHHGNSWGYRQRGYKSAR